MLHKDLSNDYHAVCGFCFLLEILFQYLRYSKVMRPYQDRFNGAQSICMFSIFVHHVNLV